MKYSILALVAIVHSLTPFESLAKQMLYPELDLLTAADVAVEASYIEEKGDFFWIKVLTVYKNGSHQVEQHEVLKVKQLMGRYSTNYFDFSTYKRARFYLQKEGDVWSLYGPLTQSAKLVNNDMVYFYFRYSSINLPVNTFNPCFLEFLEHYRPDSTGLYTTALLQEQIRALSIFNPFIKAYNQGKLLMNFSLPEGPFDLQDGNCTSADVPPAYNGDGTMQQLKTYLQDSVVNPAQMQELSIEGISFITFTIQADGSSDNFQVYESLGRNFDNEAIRLIKSLPPWKPAEHNGLALACKMTLPVWFGKKEN